MRKLPHALNVEEIARILAVPKSKRDQALFQLMYDTAMRVSEACGLLSGNLRLDDRIALVRGKGHKERLIPFTDASVTACRAYAETKAETLYFFTNQDGQPLSRQYVWQLFKRYGKAAGISKPIHPHIFRHSKATHLLDNGMDLRYLQEYLGHSYCDTTAIYTHVSKIALKRTHNQFHPRP